MTNSKRVTQIGIIGANESVCSKDLYEFTERLGEALAREGYTILNGGMHGVMEAISKGAKKVKSKTKVVGISPFSNTEKCNDYLDIIIPTGIGFARNSILVLASDVLVALGGGAGTLNEISYAWQFGKKVFCYQNTNGWSSKIANTDLDKRKTGLLIGFNTIEEVLILIKNEE